jgi:hypothetical protein
MSKRLAVLGLCLTLIVGCTRERIVYVEKPDEEPEEDLMKLGERVVLAKSEAIRCTLSPNLDYVFDLSGLEMIADTSISECVIHYWTGSSCYPDVWALNVHTGLGDQICSDDSWMGYGCDELISILPIQLRGSIGDVCNYIDSFGKLTIWGRYQSSSISPEYFPTLEAFRYDPRYRETWIDLNPTDVAVNLVAYSDDFYTLGRGGIYRVSKSGELVGGVVSMQRSTLRGLAIGQGKFWASRHDSILVFNLDGTALGAFDYPVYFGNSMTFFNGDLLIAGIEVKQNFIYVLDADSSLKTGVAVLKRILTGLPGLIRHMTPVGENLLVSGYGAKLYLVDSYGRNLREYDPPIADIHGMCAIGGVLYVLHSGAAGWYNWRGSAISRFAL